MQVISHSAGERQSAGLSIDDSQWEGVGVLTAELWCQTALFRDSTLCVAACARDQCTLALACPRHDSTGAGLASFWQMPRL